jgi:hypothetical protein
MTPVTGDLDPRRRVLLVFFLGYCIACMLKDWERRLQLFSQWLPLACLKKASLTISSS